MSVKDLVEAYLFVKVRNGNSFFWFDWWDKDGLSPIEGLSLVDEPDILAWKGTTSRAFYISSAMDILDPSTSIEGQE
ncbi:hypothetical protein ACH5RR_041049 [Cinchona calisaya]|uniref:Uncharacterized protein n=1 Tax=Cinchona calisaya TaxID=153742 RepID=A0ABD2XXP0_9GENT